MAELKTAVCHKKFLERVKTFLNLFYQKWSPILTHETNGRRSKTGTLLNKGSSEQENREIKGAGKWMSAPAKNPTRNRIINSKVQSQSLPHCNNWHDNNQCTMALTNYRWQITKYTREYEKYEIAVFITKGMGMTKRVTTTTRQL